MRPIENDHHASGLITRPLYLRFSIRAAWNLCRVPPSSMTLRARNRLDGHPTSPETEEPPMPRRLHRPAVSS
jgi:hypothetical protein